MCSRRDQDSVHLHSVDPGDLVASIIESIETAHNRVVRLRPSLEAAVPTFESAPSLSVDQEIAGMQAVATIDQVVDVLHQWNSTYGPIIACGDPIAVVQASKFDFGMNGEELRVWLRSLLRAYADTERNLRRLSDRIKSELEFIEEFKSGNIRDTQSSEMPD